MHRTQRKKIDKANKILTNTILPVGKNFTKISSKKVNNISLPKEKLMRKRKINRMEYEDRQGKCLLAIIERVIQHAKIRNGVDTNDKDQIIKITQEYCKNVYSSKQNPTQKSVIV